MNWSAFGVFLGTAFFTWVMTYWLFHLAKEHREQEEGDQRVTMEEPRHKFLQLFIVGFILIGLVLNAYSVMDLSNRVCAWNVVNQTVAGSVTTIQNAYECQVVNYVPGQRYLYLVLYGTRIIAAYVMIYFIIQIGKAWKRTRESERRRQGR